MTRQSTRFADFPALPHLGNIMKTLSRASAVAVMSILLGQTATAQTDSTGRVGITVKRDSSARSSPAPAQPSAPRGTGTKRPPPPAAQKDTTCPCYKYIGPSVLLGAVIGAGVGFTTAFVLSHGSDKGGGDYSEGWAYQFLATAGGIVGLIVGLVVGVRHQ